MKRNTIEDGATLTPDAVAPLTIGGDALIEMNRVVHLSKRKWDGATASPGSAIAVSALKDGPERSDCTRQSATSAGPACILSKPLVGHTSSSEQNLTH